MSDSGAIQPPRAGSAPATDRDNLNVGSAPSLVEPRLYIRDHTYKQYVLPYRLGKHWPQFKNFLEEVYTRRGGGEHLENIRNDKIDVKVSTSRGYDVVLPSLWDEVIVPEAHIRIAFWSDDSAHTEARSRRSYDARDRGSEFAQIEADASEDEWYNDAPSRRRRIEAVDVIRRRRSPSPPPPPPPPPGSRRRASSGTRLERLVIDEEGSTDDVPLRRRATETDDTIRLPPSPPQPGSRTRASFETRRERLSNAEDEWDAIDSLPRRNTETDDTTRPPPPPPRPRPRPGLSSRSRSDRMSNEEELSSEGEDEDSTDKESEERSEPPPLPEPVRITSPPTDELGNALSFTIDTTWRKEPEVNGDNSKTSLEGPALNSSSLNITKALTVTADDRTAVQVHTLPGPGNSAYSSSVGIRWYHLHGELLDWTQFKSICLNVPTLSDRVRKVIVKIFKKIENDNLKAFQSGMFIEPGTILRGDDANKSEPSSVIFSCIPHFDIRKPLRFTAAQSDRLHPARTLMQSYYPKYPYEPVRDRDNEQAFKKIGTPRHEDLIHVPSMWMLNINSNIVVTAGYRPLSADFVKSIELQEEDLKQLSASVTDNTLTTVRLTDLGGRTLLFNLEENQTYFELEQKVKELKTLPGNRCESGVYIAWKQPDGIDRKIGPHDWPKILRQANSLFIDLSIVVKPKTEGIDDNPPRITQQPDNKNFSKESIPPFLDWPSAFKDDGPAEKEFSFRCLELVEKQMKSETLPEYETTGPIDETFTSSKYFDSLAISTSKDIQMSPIIAGHIQLPSQVGQSPKTFHQTLVQSKHAGLKEKSQEFINVVLETLKLFVADVDCSSMLAKVWGAMASLLAITERLRDTEAYAPDPKEYQDRAWKGPKTGSRTWRVRAQPFWYLDPGELKVPLPVPDPDGKLVASLRKCRWCKRGKPFNDPNSALEHLRSHVSNFSFVRGEPRNPKSDLPPEIDTLKDWIHNDDQVILELALSKAVLILEQATLTARSILDQLRELVDGVKKEDGYMSELYKIPRNLLDTLHRLIVFYMAVERSLHFLEKDYRTLKRAIRNDKVLENAAELGVLQRFSDGIRRPLMRARADLCFMARSSTPHDYWKRMSLGPQYICAWFMRRLIVQPLDNSKTVADLYRDYLSTLQFQVNHRPGKRLLRSINLLKEELAVLLEVNQWQTRLVSRYLSVLDDETYPVDIPSRRALFPLERLVLNSCLEGLNARRDDYAEQIERCGPLTESTKQSAEINEEDHGKAILVFTVVTIVFLPLSFVTSYLGMNSSDIRDMENTQVLFWEIAIPLTVVVLGTITFIAYHGDELRDGLSACYRTLTGKKKLGTSSSQRKQGAGRSSASSSTLDYKSLADEAEYATPKLDNWNETLYSTDLTNRAATFNERTNDHVPRLAAPARRRTGEWELEDEIAELRLEVKNDRKNDYFTRLEAPATRRVPVEWELEDEIAALRQEIKNDRLSPLKPPITSRNNVPRYNHTQRPTYDTFLKPSARHKPTVTTYTRVKRDLVLPESIERYGWEWEFDPTDIDSILIKEDLSQADVGVLYAHTRRLKEVGGNEFDEDEWYNTENRLRPVGGRGRPTEHYGGKEGVRREEYTWVKNRGGRHRGHRTRGDDEWYR